MDNDQVEIRFLDVTIFCAHLQGFLCKNVEFLGKNPVYREKP
jgi:hypothetical protein